MWIVKSIDKQYQLWYDTKHVANYQSSIEANKDCDKLNKFKTLNKETLEWQKTYPR